MRTQPIAPPSSGTRLATFGMACTFVRRAGHLSGGIVRQTRRAGVTAIRIVTVIAAQTDRCFDLARDIDFHTRSLAGTGEKAVAGRTSGLIEQGESVTWEARHLGVRQQFTAEVTVFDRPLYFRDVMTAGAFRSFAHDHRFEERDGKTVMTDEVAFRSPLGPLGWLVDRLFMAGYLRRLLEGRCQAIKQEAESMAQRRA
jgi:ligand-binding SRPBCC domain-containing protein